MPWNKFLVSNPSLSFERHQLKASGGPRSKLWNPRCSLIAPSAHCRAAAAATATHKWSCARLHRWGPPAKCPTRAAPAAASWLSSWYNMISINIPFMAALGLQQQQHSQVMVGLWNAGSRPRSRCLDTFSSGGRLPSLKWLNEWVNGEKQSVTFFGFIAVGIVSRFLGGEQQDLV